MLNYLYRVLQNRKANQLLARIARIEPDWSASAIDGPKRKILAYIVHSLGKYAQPPVADGQQVDTDEGGMTAPAGQPVRSPILEECLDLWADESASAYAKRWLIQEIEITRLLQKIEYYENLVGHYQKLIECYQEQDESVQQERDSLTKLIEEAKLIITQATSITESTMPEKRLN